ncbi:biotin-dependent carboxyltransferase family protein [Pseudomonas sp. UL073]|uniref:Biotin-dependent carboxyltransferase family protein n=1 Tax=Zestomonas insulae TaxID=2809017 RepID=A0ABS2II53_9GAMM|nr:biotin-dependent carboxyltransferase family protein [Pseudomonas insulae]MBM7061533.1 biotin-dependent carboxyltransferase family protein [Pseudomonas insulae]
MTLLRVLKPGPLSLLQDGGRHGWQHLGVSPSGPLDTHAAAWANRLLGNRWDAPLLEIALGGVVLECDGDGWLALCGADLPLQLDGTPRRGWSRFRVRAGQRLELGYARSGQRAYLAASGGFRGAAVLGSVACQVREGLGGLHGDGRPLAAGDRLSFIAAELPGPASVPWRFVPDYRTAPTLRVLPAPGLPAALLQRFVAQPWHLSAQADRMGARLQGAALHLPAVEWSQGMANGAIQLPPDGQPIILQADRQTMGGYPLLGWLHPLDAGRLAQIPAHGELRFVTAELAGAQAELRRFYQFFGR